MRVEGFDRERPEPSREIVIPTDLDLRVPNMTPKASSQCKTSEIES